jgi:hypothetical protein
MIQNISKQKLFITLYIFSSLVLLPFNPCSSDLCSTSIWKSKRSKWKNCMCKLSLSAKPTEYESPTSVLPDSVLKQW